MRALFEDEWTTANKKELDIEHMTHFFMDVEKIPVKLHMYKQALPHLTGTKYEAQYEHELLHVPFTLSCYKNVTVYFPSIDKIFHYRVNDHSDCSIDFVVD
jgi:hypothetical protein